MIEHCGTKGSRLRRGAGFAAMIVLGLAALGLVVMALWNGLVPSLFGLRPIGFWQAVGLLILSRLLFGGFHRHGGALRHRRRMLQRWERMTPEERETFRHGMRGRFCGCGDNRA